MMLDFFGDLTPEQRHAVQSFADRHGPNWRGDLLDAWLNGSDAREPDGHLLRQVRNKLGPTWLSKVKN
jgi:hypothetical protein